MPTHFITATHAALLSLSKYSNYYGELVLHTVKEISNG